MNALKFTRASDVLGLRPLVNFENQNPYISMEGIFPLQPLRDSVGVMARSAVDLGTVLDVVGS